MPPRPSQTPLGRWIEQVCRERDITASGLAVRMNVSPNTILKIIAGRPVTLELLSKLAAMARVPREELIRLAGDQVSYRGQPLPANSASLRLDEIALLDSDHAALARAPFWLVRFMDQLRALGCEADDFDGAATILRSYARRLRDRGPQAAAE